MYQVKKRDGRLVPFDRMKIVDAVLAAFTSVDGEAGDYALAKAGNIADYVAERAELKELSIEDIQNLVESGLMATKRKDVARAYVTYRNERTKEREKNSELRALVKEKISASNVQNQNANVDERSFGGRAGEANSAQLRWLAINEYMSEKTKYNHENNRIYQHDLDHWILGDHNCLSIPIDDLTSKNVNTRQTDIRSPKSINTFCQLLAVYAQLQSLQQFGGVSYTHVDWSAVPFIRLSFYKHYIDGMKYIGRLDEEEIQLQKENDLNFNPFEVSIDDISKYKYECEYKYAMDMTEKETRQAVEGLYHNLNTLQSRSGNQLPFSSINYGSCTLSEGRMFTKALLEVSIEGIGSLHRTSIFPCGIFQLGKGINLYPGDPNYDLFQLALKSTAQRLYPNYANLDWSGNAGYDPNDPRTFFSTMGCRTANGADANAEPGQNPQLKDGRGNICPCTIILPTLAKEAMEEDESGDVWTYFMNKLNEAIYDAKDSLIERFTWIASQPMESAKFMYENGTMFGYKPEEGIISALKHGTLAVGQIGLAETLQILIGCDHTTKEGMEKAKEIEQLFKDRCTEFKKEIYHFELPNEYGEITTTDCHLNFGVYMTPAENLCYTSMMKFRAKYGRIPNISDKEYFTNSIHVPVYKELSPIEKIDVESQLTGYSSAGCITYVELDGSVKHNLPALETIVKYAMEKDIPYFAVNVPNDMCLNCGYTDEMGNECPICGGHDIQRLRRVTGYLTGNYKTAFNKGKQAEVEARYQHSKKMRGWQID